MRRNKKKRKIDFRAIQRETFGEVWGIFKEVGCSLQSDIYTEEIENMFTIIKTTRWYFSTKQRSL